MPHRRSRHSRPALPGPSRRAVLAGGLSALVPDFPQAKTAQDGLKDHAARAGLIFGAAISLENFPLPECRALYERETALVTTDLALKFDTLRPSREVFNFGPADDLVDWAMRKGLKVRGHNLIWNEAIPDWVKRLSSRELQRVFDEHIDRVASRYAGRIYAWDVVNEPIWPGHNEPQGLRKGPWYEAYGPGYIERALRRVRAVDKAAKCCVNEAGVDSEDQWGKLEQPLLAQLVERIRDSGAPFDALGLECHLEPSWPHNYDRFVDYVRKLGDHKLDLHITEFDVDDDSFPDDVGRRDAMVAAYAADFLNRMLPIESIKMVVTWELADKWSYKWHAVMDKNPAAIRRPRLLPFDEELRRKPMWYAMASAFDARRVK